MSVLIEGLKMPKRMPIRAVIWPNGRVLIRLHSRKEMECRAVNLAEPSEAAGRLPALREEAASSDPSGHLPQRGRLWRDGFPRACGPRNDGDGSAEEADERGSSLR
jgi:hypothetical protein